VLPHPFESWAQYLATPDSIDWSNIIVGGHSQGAGHAAYLAKFNSVNRVLLFSGPNDYSTAFLPMSNSFLFVF
jgi:predicted esterase